MPPAMPPRTGQTIRLWTSYGSSRNTRATCRRSASRNESGLGSERRAIDCARGPNVGQWGFRSRAPLTDLLPVFDVVIAGGAVSGLALAAAVKQALGSGVAIAVVDPAPPPAPDAHPSLRTVAIAEGPRRLIERIGGWEAIEPKAQAILSMEIMDGGVRDALRLPHLRFEASSGALAHMAFNDDIVAALSVLCDRLGVARIATSVARFTPGKRVAELALSDGRVLRARLAVAADGARSKLRTLAGVPAYGW